MEREFSNKNRRIQSVIEFERTYGKYYRSFNLPKEIKEDKIKAEFKDGQLTITIPKAEEVKPKEIDMTFRGAEGKQGPYELLSARRIELSTIVPGSERVYLDGRVLRRGENQDYVIDYDRGELRFMNRRRITADSEIAVDFQVNGAGYRRQTYDAHHDGKLGRFEVHGLLFSEGDDRDAPFAGPYEPDEIAALEAAGDQPVIAPGIRFVGTGRGLYRADPLDSTIVRYDPVTGDLDVQFYEAGAGQGAYDDRLDTLSGRRIFVYDSDKPALRSDVRPHLVDQRRKQVLGVGEEGARH